MIIQYRMHNTDNYCLSPCVLSADTQHLTMFSCSECRTGTRAYGARTSTSDIKGLSLERISMR